MQILQFPMNNIDREQQLADITKAILNAHSVEALYSILVNSVHSTIICDHALIATYHPETHLFTAPISSPDSSIYLKLINEYMDELPINEAISRQHPVTVNDVQTEITDEYFGSQFLAISVKAYIIFPLIVAGKFLGVLVAFRQQAEPFLQQDLSIGQIIASTGAMMLQNLFLQEGEGHALQREKSLNEITRTLSNALNLPAILQSVTEMASNLIGSDAGLLGLLIDNQMLIFYPYNLPRNMSLRPAAKGRGVAWEIVEQCDSIRLDNYSGHPFAQMKWIEAGVTAFLGVPIRYGDRCIGVLTLFNMYSSQIFSHRDLELAESIGRQAGIAIQNARMFAESKQRTTALMNALKRQEELDKLKNQFIQNVSHELRTPLGIMYGHAELLASGDMGEMSEIQQQSVEIIARRVRMLTDLVEDLTALLAAETQEFRREKINPVHLVYSMFAEYQVEADEKKVELKAEVVEKMPLIYGDITHLRRVFDNLMSNAFKYTPDGGTVTMRLFQTDFNIVIELEDTGEGIDAEQLPRIFERFYQVVDKQNRPRRKGTGLGLSLVKEIVEAHRGSVSVESELGKGTLFHIELPAHDE